MRMRLIPPRTKESTRFIGKLTAKDLLVTFIFWVILFLEVASTFPFWLKAVLVSITAVAWILSIQTINFRKGYVFFADWFIYLLKKKNINTATLEDLTRIKIDDNVTVGSKMSAIIEISGIDFEILSQRKQENQVRSLAQVLRNIKNGSIVKLEKPVDFSPYIKLAENKMKKLAENMQRDSEENTEIYTQKIDILENATDYLKYRQDTEPVYAEAFYLIIYDYSAENLNITAQQCISVMDDMGMSPKRLKDEEIKEFYRRYFDSDKDKENISLPTIKEKWNKISLNGKTKKILSVGEYPFFVTDGWGWEIFSIPNTKVVLNFSNAPKKNIYKNIDRTITELESRYADQKAGVSDRTDIANKISALQELINQLKLDREQLHQVGMYIICDAEEEKEVEEVFKNYGIITDDLFFRQLDSYIAMLPYMPMPEKVPFEIKEIQTTSLAACFPFVSKLFMDREGNYLGAGRYPIFFDLFTGWKETDRKRTNNNMSILGRSGNGKTYFMLKLIMQVSCDGARIFILDPENEYDWLCRSMRGNWIDVGGVAHGIINPMQVFPSLKEADDETKAEEAWGQVSIHRQFLEQFFQTVLPDMDRDCKPFLNKVIAEAYAGKKIFDTTDLKKLKATDFPILEDVYQIVLKKIAQKEKLDEYERMSYYKLSNYLADFAKGGLHSKLWNGYTTLELSNNFTVLNFQSLMANHNYTVANGQMLLIMRYLNQEVIRNKDYNDSHSDPRNIVIAVDEAHAFINKSFPVALTFMAQMAKRIRKYGGALLVATQNIDDFVGTSEDTKALASAVINNCQYSVVFGLNPDDTNKMIDLYKDYNGGLTDTEIDFLTDAERGMALFIVDSATRFKAHIHLYHGEEEYIKKPKTA